MLAFCRSPLDVESGDLDVQVNQAWMENFPGVTVGNVVPASQKGERKGGRVCVRWPNTPSLLPSAPWLKVKAESSAFHAGVAREAQSHVMSVEGGNW